MTNIVEKILGSKEQVKEEEKEKKKKKHKLRNEFSEDEKTLDGVARQLTSDLSKKGAKK